MEDETVLVEIFVEEYKKDELYVNLGWKSMWLPKDKIKKIYRR